MKNISKKLKLFIGALSIVWILTISFIYFYAIKIEIMYEVDNKICGEYYFTNQNFRGSNASFKQDNNNSFNSCYLPIFLEINKFYDLTKNFSWEKNGWERLDDKVNKDGRWILVSPHFSLFGYLKLIFVSIIILLLTIVAIIHRRYLIQKIIENSKRYYIILIYLVIMFFILKVPAGMTIGGYYFIALIPLTLGFFGKYVIYKVVYTVAKAIEDAKRK